MDIKIELSFFFHLEILKQWKVVRKSMIMERGFTSRKMFFNLPAISGLESELRDSLRLRLLGKELRKGFITLEKVLSETSCYKILSLVHL